MMSTWDVENCSVFWIKSFHVCSSRLEYAKSFFYNVVVAKDGGESLFILVEFLGTLLSDGAWACD
ncbi:hypothetical protein Lalb_Chr14g0366721 [Lupinus albus]|uniref:Uncharacterized protein n=1 Tax=Lupinus albus TaxID=3870 RepID=A0A6A4PEK1_LUPAL|nr:hypothetical protein Lalb_Chr14g0366721 [Lupinus albus]